MLAGLDAGAPRQVGPYRILARLGAGGMGEVYLGADVRPDPSATAPRLAAVKVMRADVGGDAAFRDRFRREIATARTVEGRFTARLLSGDAEAARPWMATEYVAGPTLERAVRETGPLPVATVLDLGLGLARALRGIHHARIRHRDLKPANVLLAADGPRVIDFGIARDFGASTMTATGAMVGSPGFMSPEHVLGGSHVVAASDIFCLATVVCYAATGATPFGDGPVAAVLYRISQADADLGAVPEQVRELVADCLSPDPFARPDAVALEGRFRAAVEAAGAPAEGGPEAAGARWPAAVQALVTGYEEELARVVARAEAVPGRVPTMPGASPVHSAETVTGGPAPDPARPPVPTPSARPSRRTVLTVLAAAVAAGVLGAFGLRAIQGAGEPEAGGRSPSPSASGSASAAAEPERAVGLDETGVDGSRSFPADPSVRPDGWREWTTALPGRPTRCALGAEVLVCRMLDGGMVAVGAADGKQRWRVPSPDPGTKAHERPLLGLLLPGGAKEPVIYGDLVVSYESGKVKGWSLTDGKVRWEEDMPEAERSPKAPVLVGEGAVFLTGQDDEGVTVGAFDADTGEVLWKRAVSTRTGISSVGSHYMAWEVAGGRVLATTDGGLIGFEARTGKATHYTDEEGGGCEIVRATEGRVLCTTGDRTVTLDEKTLRRVDDAPPPSPTPSADSGPLPEEAAFTVSSTVGDTSVTVDNEFLYTEPQGGGDRKRYRIKHAPGNAHRYEDAGFALDTWEPQLISLGGVLYLAFHDGTVRSFELPKT
ncbi:protein kinase domain-containing protein [Streptomyces sp. HMX87]|uniref:protein kinase domain-containing protein n=1 Tax=Streptomyces sp. HMX87 TaxID=3390849 RepID=UPI003A8797C5